MTIPELKIAFRREKRIFFIFRGMHVCVLEERKILLLTAEGLMLKREP